jgi:hypothetical protein
MPPSHTYPHTTLGQYPSSTTPTAQFHSIPQLPGQRALSALQAMQQTFIKSEVYPPQPKTASGSTRPSQRSTWVALTQYSAPANSTAPTRFRSQLVATTNPLNPPSINQSEMLNRNALHAGQAGFQGAQAHYNPAFFPQQQQDQQSVGGADSAWNPHGAKRTRQE